MEKSPSCSSCFAGFSLFSMSGVFSVTGLVADLGNIPSILVDHECEISAIKDLRGAREQAYAMVEQIQFQAVHYRTNIAAKAL
jgi:hypothetical protein